MLRQALSESEADIDLYTNMVRGLDRVLGDPVHLLLIDGDHKDALSVVSAVASGASGIKILLVATRMTGAGLNEAIRSGVDRVLVRPFTMPALLDEIRVCVGEVDLTPEKDPLAEAFNELIAAQPNCQRVLTRLKRIEKFTALPFVVQQVLQITDEGQGATELERAITADVSITAAVLRRANAGYYSASRQIARVSDAIELMGFRTVQGIVLALSVADLHASPGERIGLDRQAFWTASLGTAILAREMARGVGGLDAEEVFICALLADFGLLLLDQHLTSMFEPALKLTLEEEISLFVAERRVLGVGHCEIGSFVLDYWQFPERVVETIWVQQSPERIAGMEAHSRARASCVWLARWAAHGLGFGYRAEGLYDPGPNPVCGHPALSRTLKDGELLGRAVAQLLELMELFQVDFDWPHPVEPHRPEIHLFDREAPPVNLMEMLVRRLGSTPVRLDSVDDLKALAPDLVVLVQYQTLVQLKRDLEDGDLSDRPWIFVVPRDELPADDRLKRQMGLPVGRCVYLEHPFRIESLREALSRLGD